MRVYFFFFFFFFFFMTMMVVEERLSEEKKRGEERKKTCARRSKKNMEIFAIRTPRSRSHLVHVLGPNGLRDGGRDRSDAAPAVVCLARAAEDAQRVKKLLLLIGLPLLSLPLCGCRRIEKRRKKVLPYLFF